MADRRGIYVFCFGAELRVIFGSDGMIGARARFSGGTEEGEGAMLDACWQLIVRRAIRDALPLQKSQGREQIVVQVE